MKAVYNFYYTPNGPNGRKKLISSKNKPNVAVERLEPLLRISKVLVSNSIHMEGDYPNDFRCVSHIPHENTG
jgi:hypothetical protein